MSTKDDTRDHGWTPCELPERPIDDDVKWHLGGTEPCRGCSLAAAARVAREPENRHAKFVLDLITFTRDEREGIPRSRTSITEEATRV